MAISISLYYIKFPMNLILKNEETFFAIIEHEALHLLIKVVYFLLLKSQQFLLFNKCCDGRKPM